MDDLFMIVFYIEKKKICCWKDVAICMYMFMFLKSQPGKLKFVVGCASSYQKQCIHVAYDVWELALTDRLGIAMMGLILW